MLIMLVIGLLSSQKEVEEIKYIAKVCALEDRIHFLVRMNKLKELLKQEKEPQE
jgi:hypothetical protein